MHTKVQHVQGFKQWLSQTSFNSRLTFELRSYFSYTLSGICDNHFANPCIVVIFASMSYLPHVQVRDRSHLL